ncbi:hypothetical protein HYZ64_01130 [Candidatus Berkelbacteria bacterium]|nr:hypothetical protein [Candidatus Berkelbacteria bacterium]
MTPVAEQKILKKLDRLERLVQLVLSEGDELTPSEKKLVEQGHKQIKQGEYVEWRNVARTL